MITSFLLERWLELSGVVCGLLYLILMIKENIWCWVFGILGSAITVIVFIETRLYLEAGLNVYYVLAGVYGWFFWATHKKGGASSPPVTEWKKNIHIINIFLCLTISIVIGSFMQRYTDSPRPYIDAAMTIFGISATILEARKILSTWIFWFLINGFSIWLQYDREIYFYAALSVFYTFMCIKGYVEWRKSFRAKQSSPLQTSSQ